MDELSLPQNFSDRLRSANISAQRFSRISCELLGRGTIYRGANETQRQLYDDAMRIVDMLSAYWGMVGFRLEKDEQAGYLQLYPPGAAAPGVQADDAFEPDAAVRRRISPDLAALILILRYMYDESIMQGQVEDEGEVPVKIEDVAQKMRAHLKRDLPQAAGDREKLLTELRFRQVVKFGDKAHLPGSPDRIAILPTIMGLVSKDICARAVAKIQAKLEEPQEGSAG